MKRSHLFSLLIGAVIYGMSSSSAIAADDADVVVIGSSKPYVADSDKIQHFEEYLNLQNGQEKMDLTLTYNNGSASTPKFNWLRISSCSLNYLTEKNFKGGSTLTENVTDELTFGSNQVLVAAQGPKGATLDWKLTTPRPTVTAISANNCRPGDTVTITGTNFCPEASANVVTFGTQVAQVITASASSLTVKLPLNSTAAGALSINVAGIPAKVPQPIGVNLDSAPYASKVTPAWLPPGYQFTVTGNNFGSNASNVKLFIGPLECQVVSVTPTTLVGISPAEFNGYTWGYYQPIHILIGGKSVKNKLVISVAD